MKLRNSLIAFSIILLSCNRASEPVKTGEKITLIENRIENQGTNLFGGIRVDTFKINSERYITSSQLTGGEWVIDEVIFKGLLKDDSSVFFECESSSEEEKNPVIGIADRETPQTVLYAWVLSETGVKFIETDASKINCESDVSVIE